MTADLSALIARLEAAGVGSRELDGAVWYAIHEPDVEHGCLHVEQTEQGPMEVLTCELGSKYADCVGNYTTSLDAALALAERVLPGCGWDVASKTPHIQACLDPELGEPCAKHPHWAMVTVGHVGTRRYHDGATPALALCIAILRAKQGEGE